MKFGIVGSVRKFIERILILFGTAYTLPLFYTKSSSTYRFSPKGFISRYTSLQDMKRECI